MKNVFHAMSAEAIKLRSTPAVYWLSALYLLIGIGMSGAAMLAMTSFASAEHPMVISPIDMVIPLAMIGVYVLLVHSVITVTGEYRYSTQSPTFLALPRRVTVAVGKLLTVALFAVILTEIAVVVVLSVGLLATGDNITTYSLSGPDAVRFLWAFPVSTVLLVIMGQGLAWLLRNTAGAVALALLWPLAIENVVRLVPRVGPRIAEYSPFHHLSSFLTGTQGMADAQDAAATLSWTDTSTWPLWLHGAYFAVWAVAIFVLGMVVLRRRDA
ncbi:hypothetical protein ACUY3K_03150 [Corynebacterium uberis]|uniref:hypothetical protein n=1 Tax=Corynebacterium TaxID=1716 RepID=UPI001D0B7828|nr:MULTISPECIES: hypothetical protein [Corynebacterium]MCZ9309712.1 hypothetical protein [Corynebacterium sp. c6VSa_13]UDL73516.1 hypothetical protein LH391_10625 [Corynebacterium uberis]UDL75604.1 hypothetical protein LH393_10300 [Corynebacterium uberis]UDL77817.1 hypothetical protein LH394_10285 [Corynebacterium uberis]UDL80100.1 hypothetical protein LH392_10705 [Corynebacterium uberis]